jgi:2-oxoglutarate ferredoxin oxidoreductase subunit gamma
MHHEIIISGFGGQGALFAGQLIAYAALAEGRHVTWIPSYGPAMRGGTASCTIVISDDQIGSPLVRCPSAVIVLNSPSFEKFEPLVKKDGNLFVNVSIINRVSKRSDIRTVSVHANEIAAELGILQLANVVMIGALAITTGAVKVETLSSVIEGHLSARHRDKLEVNKQALQRGVEAILVP